MHCSAPNGTASPGAGPSAGPSTVRLLYNYLSVPTSIPSLDDLSEMTAEEVQHLVSRSAAHPFRASTTQGAPTDQPCDSTPSPCARPDSTCAPPPTEVRTGLTGDPPPASPSAQAATQAGHASSTVAPFPVAAHAGVDKEEAASHTITPAPAQKKGAGKRVSFDLPNGSPPPPGTPLLHDAVPQTYLGALPTRIGSDLTEPPLTKVVTPAHREASDRTHTVGLSSVSAATDVPLPTLGSTPIQPAADVDMAQAEHARWRAQAQDGWFFLSQRHLRWDVEWHQRGRQYRSYPIAARTTMKMSHTKSLCLSLNIDPVLLGAEGWAADSDSDDGGGGPADGPSQRGGGAEAASVDPSSGSPLLPLFMWQFPSSFPGDPSTVLARLSGQLEKQYETLAPRPLQAAHCPNPRPTELGQALSDARREAGDGKVLFHYFARGMPPPRKGHLFLLNTGGYGSSPYVKMPLETLRARAGKPLVMVADCPEAGEVLRDFERQFDEEHRQQLSLTRDQPFAKLGRAISTKDLANAHGGGGSRTAMDGFAAAAAAQLLPPTPVNEAFYFIGATGSSAGAAEGLSTSRGWGTTGIANTGAPCTSSGGAVSGDPLLSGVPIEALGDSSAAGRLYACSTHSAAASPYSNGLLAGQLAVHPRLPTDILTSCLTTPVRMALLWFIVSHPQASDLHPVLLHLLPGALNDKKTPLGALQWFFLCVTESIAWSVLPLPEFSRLYREDVYVAPLFRGFLLAERIIVGGLGGTVTVYPPMPLTHPHPLWDSWDNLVERTLAALMLAVKPAPPTNLTTLEFREWLAIEETTWKYQQRELALQRLHAATASSTVGANADGSVGEVTAAATTTAEPTTAALDTAQPHQGPAASPSTTLVSVVANLTENSRVPLYALQLPVLEQQHAVVVPNLLVEELRNVEALLDKVTRQSFVSYGRSLLHARHDRLTTRTAAPRMRAREALVRALRRGHQAAAAVLSARTARPPLRPSTHAMSDAATGTGRRLLVAQREYRNTALAASASAGHVAPGVTGTPTAGGDQETSTTLMAGARLSRKERMGRHTVGTADQSSSSPRIAVREGSLSAAAPCECDGDQLLSADGEANAYEAYVANPFTTVCDDDDVGDATFTWMTARDGAETARGNALASWNDSDGARFFPPVMAGGTTTATTARPLSPLSLALSAATTGAAAPVTATGKLVAALPDRTAATGMPFLDRMPIVFQGLLVLAHRDKSTELVCRLVDCGPQGVLQCAETNMYRFVLDRYWSRADLRYLMPATLFIYAKSCYADPQLIGPAKQLDAVVKACTEVLQCPVEVPDPSVLAAAGTAPDSAANGASAPPTPPPPGLWQHNVLGAYATPTGQRLLATSLLTIIAMQCDGGREACSLHGVPQLCGQLIEQAGKEVAAAAEASGATTDVAADGDGGGMADFSAAPTRRVPHNVLRQASRHTPAAVEMATTQSLLTASLLGLLVALLHDLPLFTPEVRQATEDDEEASPEPDPPAPEDGTSPGTVDQPFLAPLDGTVRELEATTTEMVACVLLRLRQPLYTLFSDPTPILRGSALRACQMILLADTPTEFVKERYVSMLLRRLCEEEMPPFELNTSLRLETTGIAYTTLKWMLDRLRRDLPLEEIGVHVGRFIWQWSRLRRRGIEPATPCLDEETTPTTGAVGVAVRDPHTPPRSPSPLRTASPSPTPAEVASPTTAAQRREPPPSSARAARFYVPPHGSQSYRPPHGNPQLVSGSYTAQPPVGSLAQSMLARRLGPAAGAATLHDPTILDRSEAARTSADDSGNAADTSMWRMLAALGNLIRLFTEHTQDVCPHVRAHTRKIVLEELAPLLHVQWFDTPQPFSRSTRSGMTAAAPANASVRARSIHGLKRQPPHRSGSLATERAAAWAGAVPGVVASPPPDAVGNGVRQTNETTGTPSLLAMQSLRVMEHDAHGPHSGAAAENLGDDADELDPTLSRRYLATLLRIALTGGDTHGRGHAGDDITTGGVPSGRLGASGFTAQESAYDVGKPSRPFSSLQNIVGNDDSGTGGHGISALAGSSRRRIGTEERLFAGLSDAAEQGRQVPTGGRRAGRAVDGEVPLTVGGTERVGSVGDGGLHDASGAHGLAGAPVALWPENVTLCCFSKQDDSTVKDFVFASLGYLGDLLLVPLDDTDPHHPYNLSKFDALRRMEERVTAGLRAGASARLSPSIHHDGNDNAQTSASDTPAHSPHSALTDSPVSAAAAHPTPSLGSPSHDYAVSQGRRDRDGRAGGAAHSSDASAQPCEAEDEAETQVGNANRFGLLCRTSTACGATSAKSGADEGGTESQSYARAVGEEDDDKDCRQAHESAGRSDVPYSATAGPRRVTSTAEATANAPAPATAAGCVALPPTSAVVVGITERLLFHPSEPLIFGFTDRGYGLTWRYEPPAVAGCGSRARDSVSRKDGDVASSSSQVGQVRLVSRYRLHHVYRRPQVAIDPRVMVHSRYALGPSTRPTCWGVPADVEAPKLERVRSTDYTCEARTRGAYGTLGSANTSAARYDGEEDGDGDAAHRARRVGPPDVTRSASFADPIGSAGTDSLSSGAEACAAIPRATSLAAVGAAPSAGHRRVTGLHLVDCASRALLCVVQRSGAVQLLRHLSEGGSEVHVLSSFETLLPDAGCRAASGPLSSYQPCSQQLYVAHGGGGVVQAWDLPTEMQTNLVQGHPCALCRGDGDDAGVWTALEADPDRPSVLAAAAGPLYLFDLRQPCQGTSTHVSSHGNRHCAQAFSVMSSSGSSSGGGSLAAGLTSHLGLPLTSALCMHIGFSSRYPHLLLGGYAGTGATSSAVVGWDCRMARASEPLLWFPATPSPDVSTRASGCRRTHHSASSVLPNGLRFLAVQGSQRHLLTLTATAHAFALVEPRLGGPELLLRTSAMRSLTGLPPLSLRGAQQYRVRGELGCAAIHPFQPLVAVSSEEQLFLYGTPSASCW